MEIIRARIRQAARRDWFQAFLRCLLRTLLITLSCAFIAVSVPKLWAIPSLQTADSIRFWYWTWLTGAVLVSVVSALFWAFRCRRAPLETAIEIDQRFRLREKISSAFSLPGLKTESPVGVALLNDATQRADSIVISEKFPIEVGRWAYYSLIPILALIAVSFVGNRSLGLQSLDPSMSVEARKGIVDAARDSKIKLQEQLKALEPDDPLAETVAMMSQTLEELSQDSLESKKDVLFKLSDMQSEIDKQREKLGNVEALQRELTQLKAESAPAKSLVDALKDGRMSEAQGALRKLLDEVKQGKLDADELKALSEDLAKMAKSLEASSAEIERRIEELERDLEKALADGNKDRAEQLKRQLEENQASRRQMEQMQKLAQGLQSVGNKVARASSRGNESDASSTEQSESDVDSLDITKADAEADPLEAMAEQLADLEAELAQCDRLGEMEKSIKALKCQCQGMDGANCLSDKPVERDGNPKNDGKGSGRRPIEEEAANSYRSQVDAKIKEGETVKYGTADGPNSSGVSREELKRQILSSNPDEIDPQDDQKLSKTEREHLREYYQKLRGN